MNYGLKATSLPSGLLIERNISLAPFTSWVVGGSADYLVQPKTIEELREAMAWANFTGLPVTLLAGGTNVLVSDKGVRGITIALRKFSKLESVQEDGRLKITCLAGSSKSELLKTFIKHRLEPALFLAGLPGDVGGGVVMNAGVGEKMIPREFVEITDWIEVLRTPEGFKPLSSVSADDLAAAAAALELVHIPAANLTWSYRHCEGWRPGVITRVGLSWPFEPKDDILPRVKAANHTRLSKQPLDMPSCGSVFVNPVGHTSGRLIEGAGLKGYSVGGAKVSEKHANFIVNFEKAKAVDIHNVITHVKKTVLAQSGVELKTEVVYIGDWT